MTQNIKTKADLEKIAGKEMAKLISSVRKTFMKRMPMSVTFTDTKPKFYLDNGDMLRAYAYDLETFEIISEAYCGSGDTVIHHMKQQFGEGQIPADSKMGILFVNTFASCANHPWVVTIVTPNLPKLETKDTDNNPMDDYNYVGSRHHY